MFRLTRQNVCLACRGARHVSTVPEPPPPPLLSRIREDLKSAMRLKEKTRLKVIRSILADVTNASKGPSPVKNDAQMLSLLHKQIANSEKASEEFAQAQREDLKAKQDAEIDLMKKYAGQVEIVSDEDVSRAVQQSFQALSEDSSVNVGKVLKDLLGPGGRLADKPVNRVAVVKMVEDMLKERKA